MTLGARKYRIGEPEAGRPRPLKALLVDAEGVQAARGQEVARVVEERAPGCAPPKADLDHDERHAPAAQKAARPFEHVQVAPLGVDLEQVDRLKAALRREGVERRNIDTLDVPRIRPVAGMRGQQGRRQAAPIRP